MLLLSHFSCVRPHRQQPTRHPHPWDSPGKNTGVGCHFLLQCMKVKSEMKSLSRVRLVATLWTAAQAPLSMGFSRQECWSGVPLSSLFSLPWTLIFNQMAAPAMKMLRAPFLFSRVIPNFHNYLHTP